MSDPSRARAVLVAMAAALPAIVGCGSSEAPGPDGSASAGSTPPGVTVAGTTPAGDSTPACAGSEAPDGPAVVPGVVLAVPIGRPRTAALDDGTAPDGRRLAKQGLWVRDDVATRLEAVDSARGRVDFWGWGEQSTRGVVEIPAARRGACARWRIYPGGYVFTEPRCAPIRVTGDGESRIVRVALGRDC